MEAFSNFSFLHEDNLGLDESLSHATKEKKEDIEKFQFIHAPTGDPSSFCSQVRNSNNPESKLMDFAHGTTTLGNNIKNANILL